MEDTNTSVQQTTTDTPTTSNDTTLVGSPSYDDTWSWEAYTNEKMPKDYDTKDFDDSFISVAKELKLTKEQAYALRQKVLDEDIAEYNTDLSNKEAERAKHQYLCE